LKKNTSFIVWRKEHTVEHSGMRQETKKQIFGAAEKEDLFEIRGKMCVQYSTVVSRDAWNFYTSV
jgi:hypothetical protein